MGNTRARPKGLRHDTRDLFARNFREKGHIPLSTYLRTFKLGDYVDVVVNSAQQKGMPFQHYHGRTGRVWNITPRAVGVELNKLVGNRIMKKRIHARVEHVRKSRCQEEFLNRKHRNKEIKRKAMKMGQKPKLVKRQPKQPAGGVTVPNVSLESVTPVPYDIVREGVKY